MIKTMTNAEMVSAVNRITAMQQREAENKEKIFGDCIMVNYAIRKNKEKLLNLLKPYSESMNDLLEACRAAELDKDGNVKIRKDCINKWNSGIKELQNIELEVDVHMVKFADIKGLKLSMDDLEAIDFMLEPPEDFK